MNSIAIRPTEDTARRRFAAASEESESTRRTRSTSNGKLSNFNDPIHASGCAKHKKHKRHHR